MGGLNSQRAAAGEIVYINATGVAQSCAHKYVPYGKHDDECTIYVHVNGFFPVVLVRRVPFLNAVLTVAVEMVSSSPFAPDHSKRKGRINITCTSMAGNIVYSGFFPDAPLKTLRLRDAVKRGMIVTGKGSHNSWVHFVMVGATKPLRGNALVWKGSGVKPAKHLQRRVLGQEAAKKQLTMKSFAA